MPIIQPPPLSPPRFSVHDNDNLLVFEFLSGRERRLAISRIVLILGFVVLSVLYFGFLIYLLLDRFTQFEQFLLALVYLGFTWLMIGVFPLASLWIASFKEIVKFSNQGITIKRYPVLGPMQSNQYSSNHIKNLKFVSSLHNLGNAKAAVGIGIQGPFNFQYGGKKFFFGMGIPQEEAEEVLALISKKFPQYTDDISTLEILKDAK